MKYPGNEQMIITNVFFPPNQFKEAVRKCDVQPCFRQVGVGSDSVDHFGPGAFRHANCFAEFRSTPVLLVIKCTHNKLENHGHRESDT